MSLQPILASPSLCFGRIQGGMELSCAVLHFISRNIFPERAIFGSVRSFYMDGLFYKDNLRALFPFRIRGQNKASPISPPATAKPSSLLTETAVVLAIK